MALTDINFQEEEGRDFIVEVPSGTLNAPLDILTNPDGQYMLSELEATVGASNIFIMSE